MAVSSSFGHQNLHSVSARRSHPRPDTRTSIPCPHGVLIPTRTPEPPFRVRTTVSPPPGHHTPPIRVRTAVSPPPGHHTPPIRVRIYRPWPGRDPSSPRAHVSSSRAPSPLIPGLTRDLHPSNPLPSGFPGPTLDGPNGGAGVGMDGAGRFFSDIPAPGIGLLCATVAPVRILFSDLRHLCTDRHHWASHLRHRPAYLRHPWPYLHHRALTWTIGSHTCAIGLPTCAMRVPSAPRNPLLNHRALPHRHHGLSLSAHKASSLSGDSAAHIPGMYAKPSFQAGFFVHTSRQTPVSAPLIRGMYMVLPLEGPFPVHTRYVQHANEGRAANSVCHRHGGVRPYAFFDPNV